MLDKKIISVSKKTDIPAFYSEWFMDKVRKGQCSYPNTFNPNVVYRCSLRPEDVLIFVFWSKNPKPLMKYLPELDSMGYKYYFQYTISPYGKFLEPNVPSIKERVETFKKLSKMIGKEKVIWRYDPIILSEKTNYSYHIERFSKLCEQLSGYTNKVVISIVDNYKLIKKRMDFQTLDNNIEQLSNSTEFSKFIDSLIVIARNSNLSLETCAENMEKIGRRDGITMGSCIDKKIISDILKLDNQKYEFRKTGREREFCLCVNHIDIGMYNTCPHECKYCYANNKVKRERNIDIESDTLAPVDTKERVETKKKGILKIATKKIEKEYLDNNQKLF